MKFESKYNIGDEVYIILHEYDNSSESFKYEFKKVVISAISAYWHKSGKNTETYYFLSHNGGYLLDNIYPNEEKAKESFIK